MAFYFPIVFNHSLTSFGKVDLKNALTPWVYFSCSNYCCVKEKQTNRKPPKQVAYRSCGQPSRMDLRLTCLCSGLSGVTWGWGWLDGQIRVEVSSLPSCGYCRLSAGTPSQVLLASPFKCPHVASPCGLSMWACLGFFTVKQVSSIVRVNREAGRRGCAIFYELALNPRNIQSTPFVLTHLMLRTHSGVRCCLGMNPLKV